MTSPKNNEYSKQELIVPAKLGIVGYGIVGQAVAYGFKETSKGKDTILFYDKFKVSTPLNEVVEKSEFIFITLPTPMSKDESGIDLSIIDENIEEIVKITNGTDKVIIIKSTVIPGATEKYASKYPKSNFAFNPEFLTEANYLQDFLNADRTVIGADNDLVLRRVTALFLQRFPKSKVMLTDPTSAEMVKIAANALLATKVTMANIFDSLCQKLGVKWEEVKNMVAADPRIGPHHLEVTSVRGWGGKCFPKDWVNLMGVCKDLGIDYEVLDSIWEYNKRTRKIHDWEEIPFAISGDKKKSI